MKQGTILLLTLFAFVAPEDKCVSHSSSCDECIQVSTCSWDLGDDHEPGKSRCFGNPQSYQPEKVFSPDNVVQIVKNSQTGNFSPQHVKMQLRVGMPYDINIRFAQEDAIAVPHHQNIIVQQSRKEPTKTTATIEVTECPKDPSKFHQTVYLLPYNSKENITLDIQMICSCPL